MGGDKLRSALSVQSPRSLFRRDIIFCVSTDFLDQLARQVRVNKSAACRRAIQRILALMKKDYEAGRYKTHTEAENEFRKLVEREESCR